MKRFLIALFICGVVCSDAWAGALKVNNFAATNITSTSAYFGASVVSTGSWAPNVWVFWGATNNSTNVAGWYWTNDFGTCTQTSYSVQATGLSAETLYYFRAYATNSTATNWATISALFRTIASTTTAPPASVETVTVNTNDVLKHPTNFFGANSNLVISAIGGAPVLTEVDPIATNMVITSSNYFEGRVDNLDTATNELNLATNSLQTQVTANAGFTNAAATAMQNLVDDTTPTLGGNLNGGGNTITNATWEGTAIGDIYLVKTGDWTGIFDGQDGAWYRDYVNITNKDAVVTNNETGLTLGGAFSGTHAGDGVGLTNTAWQNASNQVQTDISNLETSTNAINTVANAAVKRAGDIMTGPLTNVFGFYGNGVGLTNAPYGDVYLASNNTFAAISTQRMQNASVGRIEIESNAGDYGAMARYITRSGDRLLIYQSGPQGIYFTVGTNANWYSLAENLFSCHAPLTAYGGILLGGNLDGGGNTISNSSFIGNGTGLTNTAWQNASNTVLTDISGLKTSTTTLDTAVGLLNSATNELNLATNSLNATVNLLVTATNELNIATNSINTTVNLLVTATNELNLATNAINTRVGALEVPYQAFSATVSPDAGGTCTIVYASGSLVEIYQPAMDITLSFNTATYSLTSGVVRVGVEIYSLTNSVALDFATCTNTVSSTNKSTTGWTTWFFRRTGEEIFTGRQ